jgi:hypothetical protein
MCITILGCGKNTVTTPAAKSSTQTSTEGKLRVNGHWITELNGQVMLNPQTSGLVKWRDGLLTLSDRSADPSQRLRIRSIDHQNAKLNGPNWPMVISEQLEKSCFAEYVTNNPDLEALTVDPDDESIFYIVTEDASYAEPMTEECQQKFQGSGSTNYPSLLVRLALQPNDTVLITHIRPIQFSTEMQIGDFPNDGIEALAFGQDRMLYLGIEKDTNKQARILSLSMDETFWQSTDFAAVAEVAAKLPLFESGNHPINGMDFYQTSDGQEYLLVAARNDESLWVVDLSGKKEAIVLPIDFYAEIKTNSEGCEDYEKMNNASIEGVAVIGQTLWLINDPWKAVYTKNIKCPQNQANYEKFAPLLFSLPIQADWFN